MTKDLPSSSPAAAARPARLTREQSRLRTRERILASAAMVFTREGYAGASVDRIAEEAGYSKGALYSNFASKDELFLELVNFYGGIDINELCRRLDAVDGVDAVIATTCAWANELRHEPDLRLLILDMTRRVKGDAVLSARHARFFDEHWTAVGTRLLKIFPDGQSPVTARVLGALVMELSYGNGIRLHSALFVGEVIGTALRALYGRPPG